MRVDPIITGIVFVSVLIIGGIILSFNVSQGPSIAEYKISDVEKPQAEITETNFDFGKMKLADTKTKEIQIQNKGLKPLVVSDVITSCDCTFAQFIILGQESKAFSMTGDKKWRGEIPAGGSAVLKVTYKPSLMPVNGKVKREVFFKTNDPQKPLVSINFTADVEP